MTETIAVVSIPVGDQDRALRFYRDVLGFKLESDTEMSPNARWIMLTPSGGGTAITLVTWFETMPAGSLRGLVLNTPDLDAALATFKGAGLATSPVETQPWARYVTFKDPDGNGLILQQPSQT